MSTRTFIVLMVNDGGRVEALGHSKTMLPIYCRHAFMRTIRTQTIAQTTSCVYSVKFCYFPLSKIKFLFYFLEIVSTGKDTQSKHYPVLV